MKWEHTLRPSNRPAGTIRSRRAATRSPALRKEPDTARDLSDAEIVARAESGDPRAAEWLYERYAGLIRHEVRRLLGGDGEHEDLVHDAFLKTWSAVTTGRVGRADNCTAYIASIAMHVVYKELRKRYVRRGFALRAQCTAAVVSCANAEHEAKELAELMSAIADELPARERALFVLRHVDDHKLAELARMARCSLATVKRTLARAEAHFLTRARDHPEYPGLVALFR